PGVGGPRPLRCAPDGSLRASAETDSAIRVFDTHAGKLRWRVDEMTLEPFTIDFTPDNKCVLVGGPNKSLILLDASSGKAVLSYPKTKGCRALFGSFPRWQRGRSGVR